MIKDLFFDFSYPTWILFALFCVLFLAALFYYHTSLPPLSHSRRILLTILRSAGLIIVCFVLFKPVLNLIFENKEMPAVALVLDNSLSMTMKEDYGLRKDSLKYILDNFNIHKSLDSLEIRPFVMGGGVKTLDRDSLDFAGSQTNIYRALESVTDSLKGRNLRSIVLFSDGQFNQGLNPLKFAETSRVPVYTVGIGKSRARKDIRISDIRVNRVNYAGKEFPLRVRVMQNGYPAEETTLRVYQNNKLIEAKKIKLPASGFENETVFRLKSIKSGEFQYSVRLNVQEEETTGQNNRASFLIKILKGKIRVLLLSGRPCFDQEILTYCLKQLPDVELTTLTERAPGKYYEKNFAEIPVDSQDVFILLGFPTRLSSGEQLGKIFNTIQINKHPLFLFLTPKIDLNKLSLLQSILPFEISKSIQVDDNVFAHLTAAGNSHPVTRIEANPRQVQMIWSDLPPLTGLGSTLNLKKGSTALLEYSEKNSRVPLLSVLLVNDQKSLLFSGSDFDAWHLQLQDDPERDRLFIRFLEHALKWLANKEDIRHIQIQPEKKVNKLGETVKFRGQVLGDLYQSLDDAEVTIRVKGEGIDRQDVMNSENGFYFYDISGLAPGTYDYRISTKTNKQNLAPVSGKFLVEKIELELQKTNANIELLKELAEKSGGEYWTAKQAAERLNQIRFKKNIRFEDVEYNLWDKIYWLIALILVFSVEWFFRKRWGLL